LLQADPVARHKGREPGWRVMDGGWWRFSEG
jgi:hypothetical protein